MLFRSAKPVCDLNTLQAVITHRYDVLTNFMRSAKNIYAEEFAKLKTHAPQLHQGNTLKTVKHWLHLDAKDLKEQDKAKLNEVLKTSKVLATMYSMRQELSAIWERSTASKEQLLKQLQDWCHRAEASGILALQEFSRRLRCYA